MAEDKTRPHWYVVHTYAGYEKKVKDTLEKMIENRGLQDIIMEVRIPEEKVEVIGKRGREIKTQKVFPGYVLVRMIRTNEAWYIVRNTRGVTGFVGPEGEPIPLTDEEMARIGSFQEKIIREPEVGDNVTILVGALEGYEGVVEEISPDRTKVRVVVSMFDRQTPVEVAYSEIALAQI